MAVGAGAAAVSSAVLALVLAQSLCSTLGPPVQDVLPVLVHLQLDNDHLTGVDTNINCSSIGLLSLDPLNVDPELRTVTLDNLSNLLTLEVTTGNLNLVILPDRHTPDSILSPQLLG